MLLELGANNNKSTVEIAAGNYVFVQRSEGQILKEWDELDNETKDLVIKFKRSISRQTDMFKKAFSK